MTFEQANAHYTFQIIRHITWPDDDAVKVFSIAVVGVDSDTKKAFEQKKSAVIRRKAMQLHYIDDDKVEPNRYSVIYIANKNRYLNGSIFESNRRALIITEGKVDREKQMVSLIESRNNISITLNRDVLSSRGFWASTGLLDLAGTKEDLYDQLKESDTRLMKLAGEVLSRQKVLEKLNEDLWEKMLLLDEASEAISKKQLDLDKARSQLKTLLGEVDSSRKNVHNNNLAIEEQKHLIDKKFREVLLKENEIDALKVNIGKNRLLLARQSEQLVQQGSLIKIKEETISFQRLMMSLAIVVSLIFFIMIYFLLKSNRLRRQANNTLEELNTQLYELATTDSLTKLLNRRHFMEVARKELIRQCRKNGYSSLLMVDIDNFKQVNDQFGHAMGDEVIIAVANALKSDLRQYDYLGRFGGEEFVMLLPDCDVDTAYEIACRLCIDVSEKEMLFQQHSIKVTVSIGVGRLDSNDPEVEVAFHRADAALYEAKGEGKNRAVIFNEN